MPDRSEATEVALEIADEIIDGRKKLGTRTPAIPFGEEKVDKTTFRRRWRSMGLSERQAMMRSKGEKWVLDQLR